MKIMPNQRVVYSYKMKDGKTVRMDHVPTSQDWSNLKKGLDSNEIVELRKEGKSKGVEFSTRFLKEKGLGWYWENKKQEKMAAKGHMVERKEEPIAVQGRVEGSVMAIQDKLLRGAKSSSKRDITKNEPVGVDRASMLGRLRLPPLPSSARSTNPIEKERTEYLTKKNESQAKAAKLVEEGNKRIAELKAMESTDDVKIASHNIKKAVEDLTAFEKSMPSEPNVNAIPDLNRHADWVKMAIAHADEVKTKARKIDTKPFMLHDPVFQRQTGNSQASWVDLTPEEAERYASEILARESWVAKNMKRDPMKSTSEVLEFLTKDRRSMNYGSDWYEMIRAKPKPVARVPEALVKCSCGHTIPKSQVMNASMGSACPDCYDRMSDVY